MTHWRTTLIVAVVVLLGGTAAVQTHTPQIDARAREWFVRTQQGNPDRSQLTAEANAILTQALVANAARTLGSLGAPASFQFIGARSKQKGIEYRYAVLTQKKTQLEWDITFTGAGKISWMMFSPYIPHMTEASLVPDIRKALREESRVGKFSGAIIIEKSGRPILAQAYGMADRARQIPNTLDTRFRIGSMSKMFTAVSILQLVQAGKISLDAPLKTYLPDYPNRDVSSKVTIAQLLTHTGGTGDIFTADYFKHRLELHTLDDYIRFFGNRPLLFTPGSRWQYSNYGFILLGAVIEHVSGESYYDYVSRNVYAPAGMTASGAEPEGTNVADLSVGYTSDGGHIHPNTDTLPYRGTSAGGSYSTVRDLVHFADALQRNVLLNAQYTSLLTTGKVDMPGTGQNPRKYAYGFVDEYFDDTHCFGHDGGAPGMNGFLELCPAPGYVVAILANVDPPAADSVAVTTLFHVPAH